MARRVEPRDRITQKSVSIPRRQRDFMDLMEIERPEFNLNKIVQQRLDEQIAEIRPEFLSKDDERRIE